MIKYLIIISIVLSVITALWKSFKKSSTFTKIKGSLGEHSTNKILKKATRKYHNSIIINNLLLKDKLGNTSQIDHVLIIGDKIFVVETKNYKGTIRGRSDASEWIKSGQRWTNPLTQNRNHIKFLRKIFENNGIFDLEYFNIICFPKKKKDEIYVKIIYQNEYIIRNARELKEVMKYKKISSTTKVNSNMKKILYPFTKYTQKEMRQHIAKIKQ